MTQAQKPNRGVLFRNEERKKETDPEYTGSINADGVEYWINAWVKEAGKNAKQPGRKFFSFSLKRKPGQEPPVQDTFDQDFDDDIPF